MSEAYISKKAAFLVRCSTDKQDYERQIEDLQRVADKFDLAVSEDNIFGEYITGKDDTTKKDRLSIIRLREAAEAKKFDVILVAEVSRMSRDSVSGRVYIRQFCNLGIPVYFRDKMKWTINPDTMQVDESFIKELGMYFDGAAEYLKSMKTQIASGRRMSLRNNQLVIGHVPIGYKKRGGKDRKHKSELIVDDEQAAIVKDIFNMYIAEGGTLKSVALAISAKYNIRKTVSGVQQILARAEYYTGEYTVFMTDPDNKDKEPEPFTLTFEPLIDKETFDKATEKRKTNKSTKEPYPKQIIHPLSRLIKCPSCGHSFSPRVRSGDFQGTKYRMINGKRAYSWICMTRITNAGECDSHVNLNDEKACAVIWELVKKELLAFADLERDQRDEKIDYARQRMKDAEVQISLYQKEIDKTENIVKRAYNAYMNAPESVMDMALQNYNETMASVTKTKEDATSEIEKMKQRIQKCNETIAYYSETTVTAEYVKTIENDDNEKRKIFLQLIDKVLPYAYKPGKVVLEVHTINGIYYILLDGNQVYKKRVARYIAFPFAVWQESQYKLEGHEEGRYFLVKNAPLIMETEEPIVKLEYKEMEEFCTTKGWMLDYSYITPDTCRVVKHNDYKYPNKWKPKPKATDKA